MKAKVYVNSSGVKLYPVCGFQRSQHKLFYWHDKAWLRVNDNDNPSARDYEELEFWDAVLEYSQCVHDGLIYMPWKFYERVKEAIVAYDLCH